MTDGKNIAMLVERMLNSDNTAFEQLYHLTYEQAYFIAYQMTNNEDDCNDILQESYTKAIINIKSLKSPENFTGWFYQIVRNTTKNYLAKCKPVLFNNEEDEADAYDFLEDEDTDFDPQHCADNEDLQETVRQILEEIPEEKRLVAIMHYYQNMGVAEIASELGISEGTVKSRLFYARETIKKKVDELEKKGIVVLGSAAIPFFIFMLRKNSQTIVVAEKSAELLASITTASSVLTATASTAVTAAGTATAATATATGTATASGAAVTATATATATATGTAAAATGISVKVIAIAVAGTVAVGGGAVGVKVAHDKQTAETTTAIVEETTEFNEENIAVIATEHESESETGTTFENISITLSTLNGATVVTATSNDSTQTTATNTTKVPATNQEATSATKPVTTSKPATTKPVTTTKPATTAKPATTVPRTTTKPTTTAAPTTTAVSKATVTVKVYSEGSGSEYTTYTLTFDAGVTLSASDIESALMSQYGIDAMADAFSATTQAGGNYTATAYEI